MAQAFAPSFFGKGLQVADLGLHHLRQCQPAQPARSLLRFGRDLGPQRHISAPQPRAHLAVIQACQDGWKPLCKLTQFRLCLRHHRLPGSPSPLVVLLILGQNSRSLLRTDLIHRNPQRCEPLEMSPR